MGGFIERIDPLLIAVMVLLAMLGAWASAGEAPSRSQVKTQG